MSIQTERNNTLILSNNDSIVRINVGDKQMIFNVNKNTPISINFEENEGNLENDNSAHRRMKRKSDRNRSNNNMRNKHDLLQKRRNRGNNGNIKQVNNKDMISQRRGNNGNKRRNKRNFNEMVSHNNNISQHRGRGNGKRYGMKLKQLQRLGFEDKRENICLLKQYNGDVALVIEHLTQSDDSGKNVSLSQCKPPRYYLEDSDDEDDYDYDEDSDDDNDDDDYEDYLYLDDDERELRILKLEQEALKIKQEQEQILIKQQSQQRRSGQRRVPIKK
eukprot:TRINITY_DN929_c1_g2_i2.p1 TRINITY_DN929_c1_g2~~TRINITY_DN929_c1_g2_i2.p1  ORF type:complete len:275 (+),score=120.42 TRINITY_DN929_c1_g2_i2:187-1011(+)